MLKEGMGLDDLVDLHTKRHKRAKHYSRQTTMVLALVCLVFFGTILTYDTVDTNFDRVTGMAYYVGNSVVGEDVSQGMTNVAGFVTAVKTSPRVTEYKLFFYTLWILIVLVGTATHYEYENR
jgi:uncharacterized membrane protein